MKTSNSLSLNFFLENTTLQLSKPRCEVLRVSPDTSTKPKQIKFEHFPEFVAVKNSYLRRKTFLKKEGHSSVRSDKSMFYQNLPNSVIIRTVLSASLVNPNSLINIQHCEMILCQRTHPFDICRCRSWRRRAVARSHSLCPLPRSLPGSVWCSHRWQTARPDTWPGSVPAASCLDTTTMQ